MASREKQGSAAETLADEACRNIKQLLVQKKIVPGQRLIYRDLTETLKMSRTPIVNALNRLEREGFLVSEAFCGFQVKPIETQETLDLWGVREALETYGVTQALLRMTDEDISAIEFKCAQHAEYNPTYYDPRKIMLDAEFHIQVAMGSGNALLVRQLRTSFEHQYIRYRLHELDPKRMGVAEEEHRKLIEFIKRKDLEGCLSMLREHIRKGRDNLLAGLFRQEEPIRL